MSRADSVAAPFAAVRDWAHSSGAGGVCLGTGRFGTEDTVAGLSRTNIETRSMLF